MVFLSNGEISSSSVFILHCSSPVRKAWMILPLLSVTAGEYFGGAGKGKMKLRIMNTSKGEATVMAVRFNIFLNLADSGVMEKDFILHASPIENKIAGMLVQV